MFQAVERKAKQTARSVALSLASVMLMTVGAGFLTVAAWIYLSAITDTLIAASVIGASYVGFGLIFLGMAKSTPQDHEIPSEQASLETDGYGANATNAPPIMQAFLHGMQAGAHAKHGRAH